jgi:hypothetical protein
MTSKNCPARSSLRWMLKGCDAVAAIEENFASGQPGAEAKKT